MRARNEELHQRMTADVSSNAAFLQQLEKQTAEGAATLKVIESDDVCLCVCKRVCLVGLLLLLLLLLTCCTVPGGA